MPASQPGGGGGGGSHNCHPPGRYGNKDATTLPGMPREEVGVVTRRASPLCASVRLAFPSLRAPVVPCAVQPISREQVAKWEGGGTKWRRKVAAAAEA